MCVHAYFCARVLYMYVCMYADSLYTADTFYFISLHDFKSCSHVCVQMTEELAQVHVVPL